jgi:hypothetical protein
VKRLLSGLIIFSIAFQTPVFAGGAASAVKAVKLVVTLFTGAAAAKSLENAAEAEGVHKQQSTIIDNLESQGIDPTDGTIYSAYLQLDKNASAIYWERWIGWPNIFIVVQIEGQGTFLLPRIDMSYQGQPMLENIIAKNAFPGAKVIVLVLDDYNFENQIWNSILQTKINFNVTANVSALKALQLNGQADGSLQLLDGNAVIIKPVPLAYAEFNIPNSPDGRWLAEANFVDKNQIPIGKLQFAQIWKTDPKLPLAIIKSSSKTVFWVSISVVFALVFLKLLFSKQAKS